MMLMLAVVALALAEPPAAPAAVTPDDTASSLAGLQQIYDQSCAGREYGAYDDLCDQLRQQMKAARVQADREARQKAADARRHPKPAPPPQPSKAGPPAPSPTPSPS